MRRYLFFAAIALAAVGAIYRVPLWVGLTVLGVLALGWVAYGIALGWIERQSQPQQHHHHRPRERHQGDWPLVFAVKPQAKGDPSAPADPDAKPPPSTSS